MNLVVLSKLLTSFPDHTVLGLKKKGRLVIFKILQLEVITTNIHKLDSMRGFMFIHDELHPYASDSPFKNTI